MIGLKKGPVQVVPHRAEWRDLFARERRVLHEHIGRHVLDIQHVGSTAVPGLDAKPIIDITGRSVRSPLDCPYEIASASNRLRKNVHLSSFGKFLDTTS